MKQQMKKDARRKQREKKRTAKRLHHKKMMGLYRQGKAVFRPESDWMSRNRFLSVIAEEGKSREECERTVDEMMEAGIVESDNAGRIRLRPGVLSEYLQMKEQQQSENSDGYLQE